MPKTETPETALTILLNIKNGNEEAINRLTNVEGLAREFIRLGELATIPYSENSIMPGECFEGPEGPKNFVSGKLPIEEMALVALHIGQGRQSSPQEPLGQLRTNKKQRT